MALLDVANNLTVSTISDMYTTVFTGTDNATLFINITTMAAPSAPRYNLSEPIFRYYNWTVQMIPIYRSIFFPFGFIGNILALLVVMRKSMRSSTSSVFMAVLSVADSMVLLGFFIGMLGFEYPGPRTDTAYCKIHVSILAIGTLVSTYTVVAMTVERALVVLFPLKATSWTSIKKVKICETVIVIYSLIHNAYIWYAVKAVQNLYCDYREDVRRVFLGWFSLYDSILVTYIPLIIIVIGNVLIIIQIKRAKVAQSKMSGERTNKEGGKTSSVDQVTVMLLTVSMAFFFLMTPYAIFQILFNYYWHPPTMSIYLYVKVNFAREICTLLWMMNHCINIILYSMTGRKFRQELVMMVTCGRYQPGHPQSKTTTHSVATKTSAISTVA